MIRRDENFEWCLTRETERGTNEMTSPNIANQNFDRDFMNSYSTILILHRVPHHEVIHWASMPLNKLTNNRLCGTSLRIQKAHTVLVPFLRLAKLKIEKPDFRADEAKVEQNSHLPATIRNANAITNHQNSGTGTRTQTQLKTPDIFLNLTQLQYTIPNTQYCYSCTSILHQYLHFHLTIVQNCHTRKPIRR